MNVYMITVLNCNQAKQLEAFISDSPLSVQEMNVILLYREMCGAMYF